MIGEKKERTSPSTYPLLGIFAHIRAYAFAPLQLEAKNLHQMKPSITVSPTSEW